MSEKNEYKGSFLTDFYIEFLGSLVPGLFAIILSLVVLTLSLFVLCRSLHPDSVIVTFPIAINFGFGAYGLTGGILVAAYVLGSIFYRQDPKIPDWKSASRVYRNVTPLERQRLAVQPTSAVPEGCDKIYPNDVQFPYFFLHEYLMGRGLDHLAKWIPWQGKEPNSWKYRTKMFINLLKIRLQFFVPERCKDIIRNEAHVRLATSVWYATKWLMGVCTLGLIMLLVSAICRTVLVVGFDYLLFAAIVINFFILFLAVFVKWQVENFIHYLRVREIVYVLETAHVASLNGINIHPEDFDGKSNKNRDSDH